MRKNGFSLLEVLIASSIFIVLGILSFQSIFVSLKSSNKSKDLVDVRENINYAVSVIERNVRNAKSILCANKNTVRFEDDLGITGEFSCVLGSNSYVAKNTQRLTSDYIKIESCEFTCTTGDASIPDSVNINITATNGGKDQSKVSVNTSTRVNLRNY